MPMFIQRKFGVKYDFCLFIAPLNDVELHPPDSLTNPYDATQFQFLINNSQNSKDFTYGSFLPFDLNHKLILENPNHLLRLL